MDLQVFRQLGIFENLDPVQLSHIASVARRQEYARNEMIFEEQSDSAELFIIEKGRVRISKVIPGMGEEALAIVPEGAYFGEMELIEPGVPRVAQAKAHEACVLHVISYEDVHTLMSTDRDLAVAILWNFVRTLSGRLRATSDKVAATFAMAQFQ